MGPRVRRIATLLLGLAFLLGLVSGVASADAPTWEGTYAMFRLLIEMGYLPKTVTGVPEKPGLLIVTEPRPTPDQLRGLWDFVDRGGRLLLPLEVPVDLDDPLVATVNAFGGEKIVNPNKNFCYAGGMEQLPLAEWVGGMRLYLNQPTHLAEFVSPDPEVSVKTFAYPSGARVAGANPALGLIALLEIDTPSGGKAFVVADYSVVTNQMLAMPDNAIVVRNFIYALSRRQVKPGDNEPCSWLGPDLTQVVAMEKKKPIATKDATPVVDYSLAALLALPLLLVPLFAMRRRGWNPQDFLNEKATETRFRRLVRGTAQADDFSAPARQLAAEVGRILPAALGLDQPRRLPGYLQAMVKLHAQLHPDAGPRVQARFSTRAARLLATLDRWSAPPTSGGRSTAPSGGRVPGKRFLKAYLAAHELIREIGGAHLYGRRVICRHH